MIAFFARFLRRYPVAIEHIRQHRFANVYAAIVDNVDFDDVVTTLLEQSRYGFADDVIAQMPQVLRLIRIWCRKLDDNSFIFRFYRTEFSSASEYFADDDARQICRIIRHIDVWTGGNDAFEDGRFAQDFCQTRRNNRRIIARFVV